MIKRTLALVLACMMGLTLCACDDKDEGNKTTDNDTDSNAEGTVELTAENYQEYFSIDITTEGVGETYTYDDEVLYEDAAIAFDVKGKSDAYTYSDVKMTLDFTVSYKTLYLSMYGEGEPEMGQTPTTETFSVEVDIDSEGNGKATYQKADWLPPGYYMSIETMEVKIAEVNDISGTVAPKE